MGCWEDTLTWHLQAAAHELGLRAPEIRTHRVCDNSPLCQLVLGNRDYGKPQRMFNDLLGRLPHNKATRMQESFILTQDHTSEEIEAKHMELFRDIQADPTGYFPLSATSHDMISDGKQYVCSAEQMARGAALQRQPGMRRRKAETVVLTSGGSPCLPFTRRNLNAKHKGLAHRCIPATMCFVGEGMSHGIQGIEDVRFHECTPTFPSDTLLKQPLKDCKMPMGAVSICVGVAGWCGDRLRRNSAMYPEEYIWMGSEDSSKDFNDIFEETCETNAVVFYVDSPDMEKAHQ